MDVCMYICMYVYMKHTIVMGMISLRSVSFSVIKLKSSHSTVCLSGNNINTILWLVSDDI